MAKNIDDFITEVEHESIDHTAAPLNLLDTAAHAAIDHTGIPGASGVSAQNNGGALQGPRPTLNFIPSGGAGISVVDNPGMSRIDVTISAPTAGLTSISSISGSGSFTTGSSSYTHANATASKIIFFFAATRSGAGGALQQVAWGSQFGTGTFVASNNAHLTAHTALGTITPEQGSGRILFTSGATSISPTDMSGSMSVSPGGNSGGSVAFYLTWS